MASISSPSEVPTLPTLCLVGEQFPRHMIERWKLVRLINGYGPSERTICSSLRVMSPNFEIHHLNVGRPVACRYWVVDPDDHDRLVPLGCPGELLIRGHIVAQGYINDADKTGKAFTEPPRWTGDYASLDLSSRWYKSGDLVMQKADGSVTVHGRNGTQIKLTGQKIELKEIEHHLVQLSDACWKLAVELIRPTNHDRDSFLAMFFAVPNMNDEPVRFETPCQLLPPLPQKASMLKKALATKLPAYMVPQYLISRTHCLLRARSKRTDCGSASLGPASRQSS